ncbi:hypothetical protein EV421DRAFT_1825377 [Armillaria borealis]|uniref:Uncharacterized protein n=1 Tax=Armillaria borealis TaxID=47425 RepID=A0AA39J8Y8_9AGAR|nr:hypothetical protein EV421DRAFT_1825377 [Armillaria borealis]
MKTARHRVRLGCAELLDLTSPSRELLGLGRQWHVEGGTTEGRFACGDAYAQRTYQALPNTNTASLALPQFHNSGYTASSTSTASLPVTVRNIPSTISCDQRQTRAELWLRERDESTLSTIYKTRLSRAVQPAYPSDTVAVVCPLFTPPSAFRIPAPYLPLAPLKMTRSHRADFRCGK